MAYFRALNGSSGGGTGDLVIENESKNTNFPQAWRQTDVPVTSKTRAIIIINALNGWNVYLLQNGEWVEAAYDNIPTPTTQHYFEVKVENGYVWGRGIRGYSASPMVITLAESS